MEPQSTQPVVTEIPVAEPPASAIVEVPAGRGEASPRRDVPTNSSIGANKSMTSIVEFSSDIAEAEAPVPLPVGEYPAEIRAAEAKVSDKGNKYAALTMYISPDAYPADFTEGDPDGTQLTYNRLSLNDTAQARYRLRKFVENIGAKAGTSLDLNDWVGMSVTVRIKHGEWEGEKRAEIERVVSA